MKKILFGSAAAICAAIGFSSFKTAKTTTYYWFELQTNKLAGSSLSGITNTDLTGTPIATTTPAAPNDPCSAGTSFYCLAGFTSAQMTAHDLKINTVSGGIAPAQGGAYTRN